MKKLFKEFKDFINKGNAVALAIGVIIGGAFTAIVTAVNKQVISPLIGALLGDADLSESLITILSSHEELNEAGEMVVVIDNAIYWGALLQTVIDFLLTAIILFVIFKIVTAISNAAKRASEKAKDKFEKPEEVVEEVVEEAVEPVPAEPTFEEKQLELLQSINENLLKLNNKE